MVISLDGPLPKHCRMVPERHVRSKRKRNNNENNNNNDGLFSMMMNREHPIVFAPPPAKSKFSSSKTNSDPEARNCTVCLNFNSIIHLDFLSDDEMVVVEQPWLRVISTFPEAVQRRVYGCN